MNQRFDLLNQQFLGSSKNIFKVSSFFSPVIELAVILMIGVSYVFYFHSDYFLQILAALGFMVKPVRNISEQYSRWSRVQGALYEVNKLMSPKVAENLRAKVSLEITKDNLDIIEMSMNEENRKFKFHDISLPRSRMIKIMGDSGVGKSTFIEMLSGLYFDHGKKEQFALMSQFSYLFNGTLKENILYGNSSNQFTDQEWRQWFDKFELSKHSVDASIDANHFGLSGGEVQRIALMRTVLSRKKFLLLDEPFAALDIKNSLSLTNLLNTLIDDSNFSVLMVSHDKKQLSSNDLVVWIDENKKTHLIDMMSKNNSSEFKGWLDS